jgi:hypothetical protein
MDRASPLRWYTAGASLLFAGLSGLIAAAGGSVLAIVDNFKSAFTIMAGISNGGPGIWRFVAYSYMQATGQSGPVAFMKMPRITIAGLSGIAAIVSLAILTLYSLRARPNDIDEDDRLRIVLGVLALGSLVFSQFGVRAHINHSYTAMVLFVPLIAADPALRRLWWVMAALLGASHVLVLGLGHTALLPPPEILHRYPDAQDLIARVTSLPAYSVPDWPLRLHAAIGQAIERLPGDTIASLLSVPVFIVACLMVRRMFLIAPQRQGRAAI